jgi:hypothetical protein
LAIPIEGGVPATGQIVREGEAVVRGLGTTSTKESKGEPKRESKEETEKDR